MYIISAGYMAYLYVISKYFNQHIDFIDHVCTWPRNHASKITEKCQGLSLVLIAMEDK